MDITRNGKLILNMIIKHTDAQSPRGVRQMDFERYGSQQFLSSGGKYGTPRMSNISFSDFAGNDFLWNDNVKFIDIKSKV